MLSPPPAAHPPGQSPYAWPRPATSTSPPQPAVSPKYTYTYRRATSVMLTGAPALLQIRRPQGVAGLTPPTHGAPRPFHRRPLHPRCGRGDGLIPHRYPRTLGAPPGTYTRGLGSGEGRGSWSRLSTPPRAGHSGIPFGRPPLSESNFGVWRATILAPASPSISPRRYHLNFVLNFACTRPRVPIAQAGASAARLFTFPSLDTLHMCTSPPQPSPSLTASLFSAIRWEALADFIACRLSSK